MPKKRETAAPKPRKSIPFQFVLEELGALSLESRPMFGCHAFYEEGKILFILREKEGDAEEAASNGVWLATVFEHHESLRVELPSLRSIPLFGPKQTGWQMLPSSHPDFEAECARLCRLLLRRDPRIGKIPARKKSAKPKPKGKELSSRSARSRTSRRY